MIISSDHVKASALWKEFFLRSWKYFFCWRCCLGEKYARTKYFNNDFSAYFSRYRWEREREILLLSYYVTWSYWGFINEAKLRSEMQQWPLITFHEYLLFQDKEFCWRHGNHPRSYGFIHVIRCHFFNVTTVSTS